MMKKGLSRRIAVAPIDSPTMDGLELQSSMSDEDNTANATVAAAPPSAAANSTTTMFDGVKSSVHVTALDGIVNVNSLFTMAIYIGFSMTVPENATTASDATCTTSPETVRRLIVFEVVSLSFFLFSSLIAQSLKLAINLINNMDQNDPHKADIDPDYIRYGLFGSALGSVLGCLFLMLSIVDFIRVKLGDYSCGGKPVYAMVTLLIFVGSGLLVYVTTAVYASFFVETTTKNNEKLENKT
ncbi:maternal effect embryo arrest protein [Perilla frutescens var. hirtella]|uniref:Maternal effect embryo arrest protein n=1 Tax=Perilla frutescens var. hirtella TaxID=608512 RepID=A0AAD4JPQ2_PERFH|nr:maternal effect embryo arrest protein [Perilla frutescens var. hirtella]